MNLQLVILSLHLHAYIIFYIYKYIMKKTITIIMTVTIFTITDWMWCPGGSSFTLRNSPLISFNKSFCKQVILYNLFVIPIKIHVIITRALYFISFRKIFKCLITEILHSIYELIEPSY